MDCTDRCPRCRSKNIDLETLHQYHSGIGCTEWIGIIVLFLITVVLGIIMLIICWLNTLNPPKVEGGKCKDCGYEWLQGPGFDPHGDYLENKEEIEKRLSEKDDS